MIRHTRQLNTLLFLLSSIFLCVSTALAKDDAGIQLKQNEVELSSTQEQQEKLQAEKKELQQDLEELQKEVVGIAGRLQRNERRLSEAEEKQIILDRQLQEKRDDLEQHETRLHAMVGAAIRLSHTPPEAAIMMPGEFGKTLKASRALTQLSQSIRKVTESLSRQLNELAELKHKVKISQEVITQEQARLREQQKLLDTKIEKRKELASKISDREQALKQEVKRLSRQSYDLKALVTALAKKRKEEAARKEREAEEAAAKARAQNKPAPRRITSGVRPLRPITKSKGKLILPVAGKLARKYGAAMGRNKTSKGLLFKGRENARVVAPFDGEVVFTGPFLNFGDIVILRHNGEYHTLLAGFSRIDTSVGEFLLEGEPIGVMGNGPDGAELYVELRRQNQPIDPRPWFATL